jgi:hypothetical protein
MTRHPSRIVIIAALAATVASGQTSGPVRQVGAEGVTVRLAKENEPLLEVILVKRQGPTVFYRMPNAPAGILSQFTFDAYEEAEFRIEIPEEKAYAAALQRRWSTAGAILHNALLTTLPYLDLPENNAADSVMSAARYYLRAAQQAAKKGGDAAKAESDKWYQYAYGLFAAAARAKDWHPFGESCLIRAQICLLDLGRVDEAEKGLATARAPEPGDASYGVYWLAKARLLYAREKPREALDAVILSSIHETKDVETFPDALMLAAQCYEDVNEIHRARDVYYEVARLFTGTEWGDEARLRLKFIMENGMTTAAEEANITGVFFGSEEDMNALSAKYLTESEPKAKPAAGTGGTKTEVSSKPPEGEKKP